MPYEGWGGMRRGGRPSEAAASLGVLYRPPLLAPPPPLLAASFERNQDIVL